MKKYISLFILAMALVSCDDRFDFLRSINTSPALFFDENNQLVTKIDSVKTSLKHNNLPYTFVVSAIDKETAINSVGYQFVAGTGSLILDRSDLDGRIPLTTSVIRVIFQPKDLGNVTIKFSAQDDFEMVASGVLQLYVFQNLNPVSSFEATKIGVNSPYEYEFDARKSFDLDKKQGGGIQAYHYIINNTYEITTSQQKIRYIFNGPGGQEVKLEVIDNDGEKSSLFTKLITVN